MLAPAKHFDLHFMAATGGKPPPSAPEWKAWIDDNTRALELALPETETMIAISLTADEIRLMCSLRQPFPEAKARAVIEASLRYREIGEGVGYKYRPDHVGLVAQLYRENLEGGAATFSGEDNRPPAPRRVMVKG